MGTQVALLLVCNQAVAALGPWAVSTHDPATPRCATRCSSASVFGHVGGGVFARRTSTVSRMRIGRSTRCELY